MLKRNVMKALSCEETIGGAGVRVLRALSKHTVDDFDPFLQLDILDLTEPADYLPGFPARAFRGVELLTYLIEGTVEHRDSLGNTRRLRSGDLQWITAGSGVATADMPRPSPSLRGFQLWLNMPRNRKHSPAAYHYLSAAEIPIICQEGVEIRVLAGDYNGRTGPYAGEFIKPTLFDVSLAPGAAFEWICPIEEVIAVYLFAGNGSFGDTATIYDSETLLRFDQHREFYARAGAPGMRFFLFCGNAPLEPIVWEGTIVVNSVDELESARVDLDSIECV